MGSNGIISNLNESLIDWLNDLGYSALSMSNWNIQKCPTIKVGDNSYTQLNQIISPYVEASCRIYIFKKSNGDSVISDIWEN